MPAGRKPKPANMIDNDVSKYSKETKQLRIDSEPRYKTQNFICPDELTVEEKKKWEELASLMREIENNPISDADKDTMINYCKTWVSFINADKEWNKNPKYYIKEEMGVDRYGNPKYILKVNEHYLVRRDCATLLVKLKGDLMLDVLSRCKVGSIRVETKKENDLFNSLMNRKSD